MLYGEGAHNAQDKFFSGYLQRFNKLVPSLLTETLFQSILSSYC